MNTGLRQRRQTDCIYLYAVAAGPCFSVSACFMNSTKE
jgi:hypothetical protein